MKISEHRIYIFNLEKDAENTEHLCCARSSMWYVSTPIYFPRSAKSRSSSRWRRILLTLPAPLASSLLTFSPSDSYNISVGIPSDSAISSTSTGPIYIQLQAPTSYQWVGLGFGGAMAGSTIFLMYADGNGNVTASVRDGGAGHTLPLLSSTKQAGLTLLEGSGIVGDSMVANLLCTYIHYNASYIANTTQARHVTLIRLPLLPIPLLSLLGSKVVQSIVPPLHMPSNSTRLATIWPFCLISQLLPSLQMRIHLYPPHRSQAPQLVRPVILHRHRRGHQVA